MIDVESLQAGPELDALVAEKVMGWRRVDQGDGRFALVPPGHGPLILAPGDRVQSIVPAFSRDIVAAWEVLSTCARTRDVSLNTAIAIRTGEKVWCCRIGTMRDDWVAAHPDPALAICRATLKSTKDSRRGEGPPDAGQGDRRRS